MTFYCTGLFSILLGVANAVSTFAPARPPAIPLAVKSPYFSTWQQAGSDGGNGGYLAGQWPTFWQWVTPGYPPKIVNHRANTNLQRANNRLGGVDQS
jgi:hypothetical protein